MSPKSTIPVLLLLLVFPGCRSAAPVPLPVAVEESAPEEIRIYAVADILEHLGRVPLQGCCVMPLRAPEAVSASATLERALSERRQTLTAEQERQLEATLEKIRELERARDEERMQRISASIESWGPAQSRQYRGPEGALLDHIESRLAVAPGGPMPCRMGVMEGVALVARGSPAALGAVERALAELR